MSKSDEAIREFAEKWCLRVIECMKDDDYIMHDPEGILSDLTTLISELYYPKEFVEWLMESAEVTGGSMRKCWYVYKLGFQNADRLFLTTEEAFNYWKENER